MRLTIKNKNEAGHNKAGRTAMLPLVLLLSIGFGCGRNPSGPEISGKKELALFCILNPAVRNPTLRLSRSLSFEEQRSSKPGNLDVTDARILLSSPDSEVGAAPMATASRPQVPLVRTGLDFLAGSGQFNYVFNTTAIRPEQTYGLAVDSDSYGRIEANTTIPGSFTISSIGNTNPHLLVECWEPVLNPLPPWTREPTPPWKNFMDGFNYFSRTPIYFRVDWTESANAAGYLVDITVLEYDMNHLMNSQGEISELLYSADSLGFIQVPYQETPVYFKTPDRRTQRGFLTRDQSLQIEMRDFLKMIDFNEMDVLRYDPYDPFGSGIFIIKPTVIKRVKVYVHALDRAAYNYAAFQYLSMGEGSLIGQEAQIPDISNVRGGIGVFGSAVTRTATVRINRIVEVDFLWDADKNANQAYNRGALMEFAQSAPPPSALHPEPGTVLMPDDKLSLSWNAVEGADCYILNFKPHYLWFWPGNRSYLLDQPRFEIDGVDFPFRDGRLDWYVKAIKLAHVPEYQQEPDLPTLVVEVPVDKGDLVLNGTFGYLWHTMEHVDYLNGVATEWSETNYLSLPSGDLAGFEQRHLEAEYPADNASVQADVELGWVSVPGADAYLFYAYTSTGQKAIAVVKDTYIKPPFASEFDTVTGLSQIERLESGETCSWRVCALRLKTGAFGFDITENGAPQPPVLHPRYQHPAGIMVQSQWSAARTFSVL